MTELEALASRFTGQIIAKRDCGRRVAYVGAPKLVNGTWKCVAYLEGPIQVSGEDSLAALENLIRAVTALAQLLQEEEG